MSRPLDLSSLTKITARLRALPRVLAQDIAERAAPKISAFAKESFDASRDPYGAPWAPGVNGQTITLRKTGALERFVHYVAIGTKIRVSLGVKYAKYQIGKRLIYPRRDLLPKQYSDALRQLASSTARDHLERGQ